MINTDCFREIASFFSRFENHLEVQDLTCIRDNDNSVGFFNIVDQLKTLPSAFNMIRAGKLPPIIHKSIPGVQRIKNIFARVGGRFK